MRSYSPAFCTELIELMKWRRDMRHFKSTSRDALSGYNGNKATIYAGPKLEQFGWEVRTPQAPEMIER